MIMKRILLLLLALTLVGIPAWAEEIATLPDEPAYTEIRSAEDLLAIADAPEGNYVLMEDLDLTGAEWPCPSFSGKFDGNGHSLLNLTIASPGQSQATVLDGNQKEYTASFAGLFGSMTNAQVRDLNLVNLNLLVQSDVPCMAGGIAGYSMDSAIINCTVTGHLELRAHEGMFGVAGMIGYGVASVKNCQVDVTLICVDTDAQTGDEQFLGGVFGTGFVGVQDSQVNLDAYISEHGFVHSGGIGGMLLQYPIGMGREAYFRNNTVSGKIRFFEDSPIRRAYCKPLIGELMKAMNYNYGLTDNITDSFESEEIKEFDQELRPETCETPEYEETVVPASCDTFGYTQYTCKGCGYAYRDHYTLHSHTVTQWTVKEPATTTQTGISKGVCDKCGAKVKREDPVLPEQAEPETTTPEETKATEPVLIPVQEAKEEETPKALWVILAVLAVLGILVLVYILTEPQGKHLKKKPKKSIRGLLKKKKEGN